MSKNIWILLTAVLSLNLAAYANEDEAKEPTTTTNPTEGTVGAGDNQPSTTTEQPSSEVAHNDTAGKAE